MGHDLHHGRRSGMQARQQHSSKILQTRAASLGSQGRNRTSRAATSLGNVRSIQGSTARSLAIVSSAATRLASAQTRCLASSLSTGVAMAMGYASEVVRTQTLQVVNYNLQMCIHTLSLYLLQSTTQRDPRPFNTYIVGVVACCCRIHQIRFVNRVADTHSPMLSLNLND